MQNLDSCTNGITVHQNNTIKELLTQPECLLSNHFHCHTISKASNLLEQHTLAKVKRQGHCICICGLHAYDFHLSLTTKNETNTS
jgi:hypothetical protein